MLQSTRARSKAHLLVPREVTRRREFTVLARGVAHARRALEVRRAVEDGMARQARAVATAASRPTHRVRRHSSAQVEHPRFRPAHVQLGQVGRDYTGTVQLGTYLGSW